MFLVLRGFRLGVVIVGAFAGGSAPSAPAPSAPGPAWPPPVLPPPHLPRPGGERWCTPGSPDDVDAVVASLPPSPPLTVAPGSTDVLVACEHVAYGCCVL